MEGPPSRRFNWQKLLLHLLVLGLVLWGVLGTIARALDELGEFPWELKPGWLVLSGVLYALGMLPMGLFWYRGLRALGQHPKLGETLRAYYIGHLGKYVPGKAMVVVIRAGLLRSERVNLGVAAASVFVETLTMMAVGAMMAAGILIFWTREYFSEHAYLIPLAVGLMLLAGLPTLPPVFRRLALRLGVARKDPDIEKKLRGLNYGVMATGWVLVSCGWMLLALSLWAVLRGMGIDDLQPIGHLHFYTAAAALAVVAGFLSLLPGGAGVRELILTAVLGEVYFTTVLDLPLASATALASAIVLRLVWLAVELLIAAVLYLSAAKRQTTTQE